nr:unnamed protein product [Callosobruchus chinensis]
MGSTASLPRGAALLRTYSPAVASLSADRMKSVPADGYMSSPERSSRYEDPYYSQYAARSGSITPVIDEEISDTELLDDSYSLYGMKLPPSGEECLLGWPLGRHLHLLQLCHLICHQITRREYGEAISKPNRSCTKGSHSTSSRSSTSSWKRFL